MANSFLTRLLERVGRGASTIRRRLLGTFDLEAFTAGSVEGLRLATDAHHETWGFGDEESWDVDQDAGQVAFSFADGRVASAPVQFVGTLNVEDNTFMWGWDHPSVVPALQEAASRVKEFGKQHGATELTTHKVPCSEARAWEFAALAMRVTAASGAYRAEAAPGTFVFMTFGEVEIGGPRGKPVAAESSAATSEPLSAAIRRVFPLADVDKIQGILSRYGTEPHEAEPERVRRAILEHSAGDESHLLYWVQVAKTDYRDVLAGDTPIPDAARFEIAVFDDSERVTQVAPDFARLKQWFADSRAQFVEVQARRPGGTALSALVNGGEGVLFLQKAGDTSAYGTLNRDYRGEASAAREYRQGSGESVRFPAAWALPLDDILAALGNFLAEGTPASWLTWTADGVTPTNAVFWTPEVAETQALDVLAFYADLGLLADREPADSLREFRRAHGRFPDSTNPWDDVLLVAQGTERAWAGNMRLAEIHDTAPYTAVLKAWEALLLGEIEFRDIRESWTSDTGPINVDLRVGPERVQLRPRFGTGQLDLSILKPINATIASTGFQFAHVIDGPMAVILCLTEDAKTDMVRLRKFPFEELESFS